MRRGLGSGGNRRAPRGGVARLSAYNDARAVIEMLRGPVPARAGTIIAEGEISYGMEWGPTRASSGGRAGRRGEAAQDGEFEVALLTRELRRAAEGRKNESSSTERGPSARLSSLREDSTWSVENWKSWGPGERLIITLSIYRGCGIRTAEPLASDADTDEEEQRKDVYAKQHAIIAMQTRMRGAGANWRITSAAKNGAALGKDGSDVQQSLSICEGLLYVSNQMYEHIATQILDMPRLILTRPYWEFAVE
ncbi:hypothetical protein DFH09DRAFT_1085662 [Mycena vulgaris]|nr:hypothetical protein DFH09DRAFT_1085662 [Mycena vulgaris]